MNIIRDVWKDMLYCRSVAISEAAGRGVSWHDTEAKEVIMCVFICFYWKLTTLGSMKATDDLKSLLSSLRPGSHTLYVSCYIPRASGAQGSGSWDSS